MYYTSPLEASMIFDTITLGFLITQLWDNMANIFQKASYTTSILTKFGPKIKYSNDKYKNMKILILYLFDSCVYYPNVWPKILSIFDII